MRKMTTLKKTLKTFMVLVSFATFSTTALAQYVVDFEGAGEESTSYPAETVSLSGLDWQIGPEVQIGTAANDFKNGLRSARLRARDGSVLQMLEDKTNGIGTISFVYRRYGSDDTQQPWAVEYSDDQGTSWTQIGTDFTATATEQTFQETVNAEGDIRIRIRLTTTPGTSGDRRMNVDDITISDYVAGAPVLTSSATSLTGFTYEEGNGPATAQTITVAGNNLVGTGNVVVTASANFEVSVDGTSYASSVNLPYDQGVITGSGTVYIRLNGGLTPGVYSGNVTIDGGNAPTVTVTTSGIITASLYPPVHALSSGAYNFTNWSDASAIYTYPSNIRFWTAATDAVTLNEQPVGNYTGAYNLTSASRINGLNADGISFIATGSTGAGYPLGAVLGINTTGKENIEVSWTGGLITQGAGTPTPRFYGLRLQYQIGQGATWTDVPGPIEYLNENQVDGHTENFGPTTLPATCNNQSEVYLRWVYHFIAANDGGSRPNIRLDEILVDASDIVDPSVQASTVALSGFDQIVGTPSAEQSFTVSGSNLTENIDVTVTGAYELSLTSGSGFTTSLEIPQVAGTVTSTTVYVRLNATAAGTQNGTITVASQNATDVIVNLEGETTEMTEPETEELLYYWHFNNMETGVDVTEIIADYSYLPDYDGKFTYTDPIPGERDIDRYDVGSSLNLQQSEAEGFSARVRNPSVDRSLVFDVPTTGSEGIGLRYAVQRSGSGMLFNAIQYSVDGNNFISTDLVNDTLEVMGDEVWQLFTFDFSSIEAINDNPNFKIKITWIGNNATANGNNRYDNITLTATSVDGNLSVITSENQQPSVYPVPFTETINITAISTITSVEVIDLSGKVVKTVSGNQTHQQHISTVDLNPGTYLFAIQTAQGTYYVKSVKK